MFHIILYEPEIPPNTGNIIRLCANTGALLHIIHPASFTLDDKRLKRAGLDYHEFSKIHEHDNFERLLDSVPMNRIFACSTKGKKNYSHNSFRSGDAFLFGPETRGLPALIIQRFATDKILRIPMTQGSRSLNLSNSVAIVLYEAWRQISFSAAADNTDK